MKESSVALTEDQAMKLIAFLVSSAEISIREPIHYGTLRLVDAASRLIGYMEENGSAPPGSFLSDLKTEIDIKKLWAMWDQPAYFDFLRETPGKVGTQVAGKMETIDGR